MLKIYKKSIRILLVFILCLNTIYGLTFLNSSKAAERLAISENLENKISGVGSKEFIKYEISSKAYEVKELNNSQAISSLNQNKKYPVASLAKLITIYIALDEIQKGRIHTYDRVSFSSNLIEMSQNPEYGTVPIDSNEYTVFDLIQMALISSSNSAAIELGIKIAGNNTKFINLENKLLKKWKIKSQVISSSGLERTVLEKYGIKYNKKNLNLSENLFSPKEMTTITENLVNKFPQVLKIGSKTQATLTNGNIIYTHNELLKGGSYYNPNIPIYGLKTGFTYNAGKCLITIAKIHKHKVIIVDLGSENAFKSTSYLLKYFDKHYPLLKKINNRKTTFWSFYVLIIAIIFISIIIFIIFKRSKKKI